MSQGCLARTGSSAALWGAGGTHGLATGCCYQALWMVSEALSPQCHWGSPLCSFVPWQSSRKQIPPPESSDPRLDAATLCCSVPLGHRQFCCTDLARPLRHHIPALSVPNRGKASPAPLPQKCPRGDPGTTKQTRYPTLLS